MSECPNSSILSAYYDGELDEARRGEVERHLRDCSACEAELGRLREMSRLLSAGKAPALLPMAMHRLHKKVDVAMEEGMLRIMRVLNAIAACVLIAGSAWLVMKPHAANTTVEKPAAPPWVISAEYSDSSTGADSTPAAAWYLADDTSRNDDTP
jgi:anti-sigma factor RsiW